MPASGAPGITQLTNDDNNDLWPSVDAARHLFYQAFIDTRPDARLFLIELGKTTRTDLTQAGGFQPRVSPDSRPDSSTLVFNNINEKTQKRDIFTIKTDGGIAENLTNTPDDDEFDAAWNHEGTKLAYVSDRGTDDVAEQDCKANIGRHHYVVSGPHACVYCVGEQQIECSAGRGTAGHKRHKPRDHFTPAE